MPKTALAVGIPGFLEVTVAGTLSVQKGQTDQHLCKVVSKWLAPKQIDV